MKYILRNGFQEYAIRDPYAPDREDVSHPVQFDQVNTAQSFLRRFLDGNANHMTLRDILTRHEIIGRMSLMTIDDVVEQIAQKLVSGELQVEALPIVVHAGRRGQQVEAEESAAEETPPPQEVSESETETDWITIELVGEDDKPIPSVRYEITKPDGATVAEGMLDGNGHAHERGLESGTYMVSFLDLDKEAWEHLESVGEKE